MGWFISPTYSSLFIAGVALHLIQDEGVNPFNAVIMLASVIVSSVRTYAQAADFMVDPTVVEKSLSVVFVWLFYGVLYSLSIGKFQLKDRTVYVTLGAITYPLYLIHNIAGKAIIDYYSGLVSEQVMIWIVVLLMILISWVIYLVVEKSLVKPLKRYLLLITDRNRWLFRSNQ